MANGFGSIPSILGSVANARQIEAADQRALANQVALAAQQAQLAQALDPQVIALQQLQRQLQTRQIQQQLADLDNPNAALVRQVQRQLALQSINPASGIVAAPAGLEGETIFTPGALTQEQQASLPLITTNAPLTPGQAEAFPDLVREIPRVAPGTPIQPILVGETPTGFAQDIGRIEAGEQRKLQNKIAEIEARAKAQGVSGRTFVDETGNVQFIPTRTVAGEAPTATQIKDILGAPLKAPSRSAGRGAAGLSPFAIANISGKAGKAGLTQEDIDRDYTENGVVDWNRLNLDANRRIQEASEETAKIKATTLSATERGKATSFIAAHQDLGELGSELKAFKASGRDPGAWERAVGVALESPPDSIWSALYQSVIGQGLTADARELNALKARVRSAVTKANAGLSQTEREIANVTQYAPATNDNLEQTLLKAAGLEGYLVGQVRSITTDPKEWLKSLESKPRIFPGTSSNITPAVPSAPVRVTTRDQYNALPKGASYIDSKGVAGIKR